MNPSDEDIKRLATKLDEAYHGDLSDCPILLDARDMLLTLKARAETAENQVIELRSYNERLSGLVDKWHRDAVFYGTACDEQKKRAEAAEKERDALRKSYPVDLDMDAALRRAEAAEKELIDTKECAFSWSVSWSDRCTDAEKRAEAAEKDAAVLREALKKAEMDITTLRMAWSIQFENQKAAWRRTQELEEEKTCKN